MFQWETLHKEKQNWVFCINMWSLRQVWQFKLLLVLNCDVVTNRGKGNVEQREREPPPRTKMSQPNEKCLSQLFHLRWKHFLSQFFVWWMTFVCSSRNDYCLCRIALFFLQWNCTFWWLTTHCCLYDHRYKYLPFFRQLSKHLRYFLLLSAVASKFSIVKTF